MDPRLKQLVKRFGLTKRLVANKRGRETRQFRDWWRRHLTDGASTPDPDEPRAPTGPTQAAAPRVLMATSLGGWQPGTRLDTVVAHALRLRGAEVEGWLCDQALPACQLADAYFYPRQEAFLRNGPIELCRTCAGPAEELFEAARIPLHRLSSTLTEPHAAEAERVSRELEIDEILALEIDGVTIGEHALSGALRFFASGDLHDEPQGEAILRAYLRAALRTFFSFRELLDQTHFDCVVLHHGIYVPQGPIADLCRQRSVRVVTWHPAYRRNCFTFAESDTYHRAMLVEPTSVWEQMDWSEAHEAAIMDYLKSRWRGSEDWISFNDAPEDNLRKISDELGLDPDKPWIGLLTTVMWDARLHYPTNAYENVWYWVRDTIEYFAQRPDLQLIIRVHPAEVRGRLPARQRMDDEIKRAFPTLPNNVVVIPAESRISSYVVLANCNAALIYATKMGIELTATGIPTLVAGEAWIRNKGFSLDAGSPAEYRELLDRLPLPERMSPEQVAHARKYAFHYFFRRMIPLQFVSQGSSSSLGFEVDIERLDDLQPGRFRGLDVICDGILEAGNFVYPAETEIRDKRLGINEPEPHQAVH